MGPGQEQSTRFASLKAFFTLVRTAHAQGVSLAGITVLAQQDGSTFDTDVTDTTGNFTLEVPAGTITLAFSTDDFNVSIALAVPADSQVSLVVTLQPNHATDQVVLDEMDIAQDNPVDTPTDPLLNEFVFNHVDDDTYEYVEVFGHPGTDYSAFTVLAIAGESAQAGLIDAVFPVGITNAGGYWTTAFQTEVIADGPVTLLLVEGFTGNVGDDLDLDDDGTPDAPPWTRIVDEVAVSDGDVSGHTYSSVILLPDFDGINVTPGGASRIPDGTDTDTVDDWMRNDFDGAGLAALAPGSPDLGEALNTPDAVNVAVGDNGPVAINEIRTAQPEPEVDEYFELAGLAGATLADLTYLVIDNGTADSGVITAAVDLSGNAIPGSGFFVVAEAAFSLGTATLTADLDFENSDNVTHMLVEGFTGSVGDDLDTDDDGILNDVTPWSQLVDCVALVGSGNSDTQLYCTTTVGPDDALVPRHAFLCPAGWEIGAFSGGDDTPGATNACPTPENTMSNCDDAYPSVATIWPPNHKFVAIDILGVTETDSNTSTITIDSIFQDEAVDAAGSGNTSPDGQGMDTVMAQVRAERVGSGNGRVYHIGFTADDGNGGTCSGEVLVGVPKNQGEQDTPVDDGALHDSTVP
jgi:hypothetical protein